MTVDETGSKTKSQIVSLESRRATELLASIVRTDMVLDFVIANVMPGKELNNNRVVVLVSITVGRPIEPEANEIILIT